MASVENEDTKATQVEPVEGEKSSNNKA